MYSTLSECGTPGPYIINNPRAKMWNVWYSKIIMLKLYSPRKRFPCYVLSYMYFMLMVTSGISMHAIKPLKELSTDEKYSYSVMPKMPSKICICIPLF